MHGFDIPRGFTPEVTPLVFEHFGKWGSGARDFLKSLGDRSTDDFGRKNKAEFMFYWRRRFGVALQRANAQLILRKLDRLTDIVQVLFSIRQIHLISVVNCVFTRSF